MKIRVSTVAGTPRFVHGGMTITSQWQEIDLDTLTPEARDGLELYLGRIVQVHPDDRDKFIADTGLEEIDGGILALPKKDQSADAIPVGERHQRSEAGTPAKGTPSKGLASPLRETRHVDPEEPFPGRPIKR